jgi:hypothetical protein
MEDPAAILGMRGRGVYSMHLQQYLNAPSQQIQGEPDEDHN